MSGWIARATAVSTLAAVCVSGCTRSATPEPVGAADLQRGLTEMLVRSGTPSTWVSCEKELPARVGATTRCDVAFNSTDSVTALLTTTQVAGGKVDWEVTGPSLTRDQVAKRAAGKAAALGVTCDSELDGQVGDWAQCHSTRNGAMVNLIAEVTAVKSLVVDVSVHPVLPKQEVEQQLRARLTPPDGPSPDAVNCGADLPGIVGSTVDCAVRTGEVSTGYVVKVTGVQDGSVAFDATTAGPA